MPLFCTTPGLGNDVWVMLLDYKRDKFFRGRVTLAEFGNWPEISARSSILRAGITQPNLSLVREESSHFRRWCSSAPRPLGNKGFANPSSKLIKTIAADDFHLCH
jgi:hypothetical protein